MEDVRTIHMYIDTLYLLAVDVTTKMRTLVYYQTFFARLLCAIGECGSEQAGTNYEIIVVYHIVNIYIHDLAKTFV